MHLLTKEDFKGLGIGIGESLKRIIDSVRENHGVMLKGKRRRPDILSVYFSWYMEKFEGTEKKYTQIRVNSGGGVKQKLMARNANYETCFQAAKNVFFPNGKNAIKGYLTNYICELMSADFQTRGVMLSNTRCYVIKHEVLCYQTRGVMLSNTRCYVGRGRIFIRLLLITIQFKKCETVFMYKIKNFS